MACRCPLRSPPSLIPRPASRWRRCASRSSRQSPAIITIANTTSGVNNPVVTITPTDVGTGGRILRITPSGIVSTFAQNFHTSNATDSSAFTQSSLSDTFSSDGTTFYVADDDAIWQFKTVTSLAGSDSGSLIGLNDLRSLGVPYDGEGSAVAIVDTGVDALSAPFRGRVAPGTNVITGGLGNDDTAIFSNTTTNVATAGARRCCWRHRRGHRHGHPSLVRWPRYAGRGRCRPVRATSDDRSRQHL